MCSTVLVYSAGQEQTLCWWRKVFLKPEQGEADRTGSVTLLLSVMTAPLVVLWVVAFRHFISLVFLHQERKDKLLRLVVLQAFPLPSFNRGVLCWLKWFTIECIYSNVTFHHRGVWSKCTEPQEDFTIELPFRFQWRLIPPGTIPPQADNYKPLWFNALRPWSLSIIAWLHSIDCCFDILKHWISLFQTMRTVLV